MSCALIVPATSQEFVIDAGGTRVQVLIEPALPPTATARVTRWVQRSTAAIASYAGAFPVPELYLAIRAGNYAGIGGGKTFATDPPVINIELGAHTTAREFDRDWVLVHEMAHLAVPSLPARQRWFEEGLAVYVESMARAGAGMKDVAATWADLVNGMPNGQPERGEHGLDGTTRWGRVYWGGATFMLRVDIAGHLAGGRGIRDLLRAWRQRGWDVRSSVSLEALLAAAGGPHGQSVALQRYQRDGAARAAAAPSERISTEEISTEEIAAEGIAAEQVPSESAGSGNQAAADRGSDLAAMWRALGIVRTGVGRIAFDDTAPQASIRQRLTRLD